MHPPHPSALLILGLVLAASPVAAQPLLDPNYVEFTASADHDARDQNGAAMVDRYDFVLYAVGSRAPIRVVSMGKPTPDASRTIRAPLATLLTPLPAGGTTYEVRIAAVGPGGTATSAPSNGFTFQAACTYSVSPAGLSMGSTGGSSSFSVTAPAGCAWTVSTASSWIALTRRSGSGSGTASFTAAPNPSTSSRSASIAIAGVTRTVTQSSAPCTYTVSPTSASVPRAGGNISFSIATPGGCRWSASEGSSWITIASGANGTGAGTVTFTVAVNTSAQVRSTTTTIAGRRVTVSQQIATRPRPPGRMRIVE